MYSLYFDNRSNQEKNKRFAMKLNFVEKSIKYPLTLRIYTRKKCKTNIV